MSVAQTRPAARRLARVGGIELGPQSCLAVWACTDPQGKERRVCIDVQTAHGFTSVGLPSGLIQQLEKLLRAGAYMAEVAGEMSAEEWAAYQAAENAAAISARKEGGAV